MQAQQPKSPIHSVLWVRLTLISEGPDYAGPTQEEGRSLASRGRCTPTGRLAAERCRRGAPEHCSLDSLCLLGDANLKDNGRDTEHSQEWGTVELASPHYFRCLLDPP